MPGQTESNVTSYKQNHAQTPITSKQNKSWCDTMNSFCQAVMQKKWNNSQKQLCS